MIVADKPSTDLGKMHYGDKNVITFFAEIELSAGNEEESVSSFLQENGKELIVADRPSTERIQTDLGKFIMEIKNVITYFAEIELVGNEEESVSSFLQ